MKDLFLHHWYVGAVFSVLYTIGSAWWTVRAERMLRQLRQEQKVMAWTYEDLRHDVDNIESYLEENGNTLRKINVFPIERKKSS